MPILDKMIGWLDQNIGTANKRVEKRIEYECRRNIIPTTKCTEGKTRVPSVVLANKTTYVVLLVNGVGHCPDSRDPLIYMFASSFKPAVEVYRVPPAFFP